MKKPDNMNEPTMHLNIQPKNDFIVALDIGTTKIVMMAGQQNEKGRFEILGYGKVLSPSGAIRNGQVLNVEETANSIRSTLEMVLQSNEHIESISEVYVGIAGEHVKCLQTRGDLVRQGESQETIRQEEVDKLIENQYKSFVPANSEIMHVYPLSYFVDNHLDINQPVGMHGNKLGGNFNLISADKTAILQIKKSIEKAKLKMAGIFLQPTASSQAVMCTLDTENIVAVLDIGGGTSDLAVYDEGKLIHTVVIPMGGSIITQDIQKGLGVLRSQAEALKIQFGAAMIGLDPKKKKYTITIPGYKGLSNKEVDPNVLCGIIQARIEEILYLVTSNLQSVGLNGKQLSAGLIVTGGGSQLKHLKQFAEFKVGAEVRIGYANEHLANDKNYKILKSPSLATCIGILIEGQHHTISKKNQVQKHHQEPNMLVIDVDGDRIGKKEKELKPEKKNEKRKKIFSSIPQTVLDIFKENKDNPL